MKVRINNEKSDPVKVVLEPWASEYKVQPSDFIDFVSEGKTPENAFFQIDNNEYGIIVYPEWEGALVYAYNSDGQVID